MDKWTARQVNIFREAFHRIRALERRVAVLEGQPPAWQTIDEFCASQRVSRRTVYNWLAAGKLTTRRTPSGHVRIARSVS